MTKCALAFALKAAGAAPAFAYDADGRLMVGTLRGTEKHSEPSAGATSNDRSLYLGRFYLDLTKLGPYSNQLTIDLRDRFDSFGSLDGERQVLVDANQPELRQLALRYPYERGSLFWSVGRFPIFDAGVQANDGAELGYRTSKILRFGTFGGLVPKHANQKTTALNSAHRQAGVYAAYDNSGTDWNRYTSFSNALIFESEDLDLAMTAQDEGSEPSATDGTSDVLPPKTENRLYLYSNNIIQTPNLRLNSWMNVYLTPKAAVRNIWFDATQTVSTRQSFNLNFLHLDLTWYDRTRELRDVLAPSVFDQVRGSYRYKLSEKLTVETLLRYGMRSADQLSRFEASFGILMGRLMQDRLNFTARVGAHKNFQSRDQYLRAGVRYFLRNVEVSLDQTLMTESKDAGRKLTPMITMASANFIVATSYILSASLEFARDEEVTLVNALLTATYRFNSKQLTPMRSRALPVERL